MPGLGFGRFAPSPHITEGRRFRDSGELTATVTSRASGQHLTLRLRCLDAGGQSAVWEHATQVVVEDFDGEFVAMYDRDLDVIAWGPRATDAIRWSVAALFRYLAGADRRLVDQAELAAV